MVLGTILTHPHFPCISIHLSILHSVLAIYIPSIGGGMLPFLHTFTAVIVCQVSRNGHSDCCVVIPRCGFDLHFFDI